MAPYLTSTTSRCNFVTTSRTHILSATTAAGLTPSLHSAKTHPWNPTARTTVLTCVKHFPQQVSRFPYTRIHTLPTDKKRRILYILYNIASITGGGTEGSRLCGGTPLEMVTCSFVKTGPQNSEDGRCRNKKSEIDG